MKNLFRSTAASSVAAAAALVLLNACGGGGGATTQEVAISFKAIANGAAIACGTQVTGLGSKPSTATVRDVRFYVSNVNLLDAAGNATPVTLSTNSWQSDKVALISLLDATGTACSLGANAALVGTAPSGTYTGLSFEIGVPESVNHTDTTATAAPLNVAAMAWSWQAGRKFAKIEVDPAGGITKPDATAAATWFMHLGSTGCTASTANATGYVCTNPNRMPVILSSFNTATQAAVLDLTALFTGSDLSKDQGGAVGCMSGAADKDCPAIFSALKIDFATGAPVSGGSTAQRVFIAGTK